jgi:hypothetical protein
MQIFRKKCTRVTLAFVTGLVFLIIGFVLLEMRILKLDQDSQMSINIYLLLASATAEEERDCTTESLSVADEEYLAGHSGSETLALTLIRQFKAHCFDDGALRHGYLKKFLPPPEARPTFHS